MGMSLKNDFDEYGWALESGIQGLPESADQLTDGMKEDIRRFAALTKYNIESQNVKNEGILSGKDAQKEALSRTFTDIDDAPEYLGFRPQNQDPDLGYNALGFIDYTMKTTGKDWNSLKNETINAYQNQYADLFSAKNSKAWWEFPQYANMTSSDFTKKFNEKNGDLTSDMTFSQVYEHMKAETGPDGMPTERAKNLSMYDDMAEFANTDPISLMTDQNTWDNTQSYISIKEDEWNDFLKAKEDALHPRHWNLFKAGAAGVHGARSTAGYMIGAVGDIIEDITGYGDTIKHWGDEVGRSQGEAFAKAYRPYFDKSLTEIWKDEDSGFVNKFISTIGKVTESTALNAANIVPGLIAGAATEGTGLVAYLGYAGLAGQASLGLGEVRSELIDKGIDPDENTLRNTMSGAFIGLVDAISDKFGMGIAEQTVKKLASKEAVGAILVPMVVQAPPEAVQEFTQIWNAAQQGAEYQRSEYIDRMVEAAADALLTTGAVKTGLMGLTKVKSGGEYWQLSKADAEQRRELLNKSLTDTAASQFYTSAGTIGQENISSPASGENTRRSANIVRIGDENFIGSYDGRSVQGQSEEEVVQKLNKLSNQTKTMFDPDYIQTKEGSKKASIVFGENNENTITVESTSDKSAKEKLETLINIHNDDNNPIVFDRSITFKKVSEKDRDRDGNMYSVIDQETGETLGAGKSLAQAYTNYKLNEGQSQPFVVSSEEKRQENVRHSLPDITRLEKDDQDGSVRTSIESELENAGYFIMDKDKTKGGTSEPGDAGKMSSNRIRVYKDGFIYTVRVIKEDDKVSYVVKPEEVTGKKLNKADSDRSAQLMREGADINSNTIDFYAPRLGFTSVVRNLVGEGHQTINPETVYGLAAEAGWKVAEINGESVKGERMIDDYVDTTPITSMKIKSGLRNITFMLGENGKVNIVNPSGAVTSVLGDFNLTTDLEERLTSEVQKRRWKAIRSILLQGTDVEKIAQSRDHVVLLQRYTGGGKEDSNPVIIVMDKKGNREKIDVPLLKTMTDAEIDEFIRNIDTNRLLQSAAEGTIAEELTGIYNESSPDVAPKVTEQTIDPLSTDSAKEIDKAIEKGTEDAEKDSVREFDVQTEEYKAVREYTSNAINQLVDSGHLNIYSKVLGISTADLKEQIADVIMWERYSQEDKFWMKAPDGTSTLLTVNDWIMTHTSSFMSKFGNVRKNEHGEPAYHYIDSENINRGDITFQNDVKVYTTKDQLQDRIPVPFFFKADMKEIVKAGKDVSDVPSGATVVANDDWSYFVTNDSSRLLMGETDLINPAAMIRTVHTPTSRKEVTKAKRRVIRKLNKKAGVKNIQSLLDNGELTVVTDEVARRIIQNFNKGKFSYAVKQTKWYRDTDQEYSAAEGEPLDVKCSEDGKIQGVTLPNGQVVLVAENIGNDEELGVFAHELGVHSRILGFKKVETFVSVLDDINTIIESGEPLSAAMQEALDRIPGQHQNLDPQVRAEEVLGYMVENHPEVGFVRKFIAAFKKWIVETFGIDTSVFNEEDIRAMALAAIEKGPETRTVSVDNADAIGFTNEVEIKLRKEFSTEYDQIFGTGNVSVVTPRRMQNVLRNFLMFSVQRAWHGTQPTDIRQMSTDYIGTGEGSAGFGWGLYFSGEKEFADFYRKMVIAEDLGIDIDDVTEEMGRTYEVEIPGNESLLDYDKSLDSQSEIVKEAFPKLFEKMKSLTPDEQLFIFINTEFARYHSESDFIQSALNAYDEGRSEEWIAAQSDEGMYEHIVGDLSNPNGKGLYRYLEASLGSARDASLYLLNKGIKGSRYADAEQGHNFIVYDGADTRIVDVRQHNSEDVITATTPDGEKYVTSPTLTDVFGGDEIRFSIAPDKREGDVVEGETIDTESMMLQRIEDFFAQNYEMAGTAEFTGPGEVSITSQDETGKTTKLVLPGLITGSDEEIRGRLDDIRRNSVSIDGTGEDVLHHEQDKAIDAELSNLQDMNTTDYDPNIIDEFLNILPRNIRDEIEFHYDRQNERTRRLIPAGAYSAYHPNMSMSKRIHIDASEGRTLGAVIKSISKAVANYSMSSWDLTELGPLYERAYKLFEQDIKHTMADVYGMKGIDSDDMSHADMEAMVNEYLSTKGLTFLGLDESKNIGTFVTKDQITALKQDIAGTHQKIVNDLVSQNIGMKEVTNDQAEGFIKALLAATMTPVMGKSLEMNFKVPHGNTGTATVTVRTKGEYGASKMVTTSAEGGEAWRTIKEITERQRGTIFEKITPFMVKSMWFPIYFDQSFFRPRINPIAGKSVLGELGAVLSQGARNLTVPYAHEIHAIWMLYSEMKAFMARENIKLDNPTDGYLRTFKDNGIEDVVILERAALMDKMLKDNHYRTVHNVAKIHQRINEQIELLKEYSTHDERGAATLERRIAKLQEYARRYTSDWNHTMYHLYTPEGMRKVQWMKKHLNVFLKEITAGRAADAAQEALNALNAKSVVGEITDADLRREKQEHEWVLDNYKKLEALKRVALEEYSKLSEGRKQQQNSNVFIHQFMNNKLDALATENRRQNSQGGLGDSLRSVSSARERKLDPVLDSNMIEFLGKIDDPFEVMMFNVNEQAKVISHLDFIFDVAKSILETGTGQLKGSGTIFETGGKSVFPDQESGSGTILEYVEVDPLFADYVHQDVELNDAVLTDRSLLNTLLSTIKKNLTVYNPKTGASNYIGNIPWLLYSGNLLHRATHLMKAGSIARRELMNRISTPKKLEAEKQMIIDEMNRAKLFGSSHSAFEGFTMSSSLMDSAVSKAIDAMVSAGATNEVRGEFYKNLTSNTARLAQEAYSYGDEWVKVFSYMQHRELQMARARTEINRNRFGIGEVGDRRYEEACKAMAIPRAAARTRAETTEWSIAPDLAKKILKSHGRLFLTDFLMQNFQVVHMSRGLHDNFMDSWKERNRIANVNTSEANEYRRMLTGDIYRRMVGGVALGGTLTALGGWGISLVPAMVTGMAALIGGGADDDTWEERRKKLKNDNLVHLITDYDAVTRMLNASGWTGTNLPCATLVMKGDKILTSNAVRGDAMQAFAVSHPASDDPKIGDWVKQVVQQFTNVYSPDSETIYQELYNVTKGIDKYGRVMTDRDKIHTLESFLIPGAGQWAWSVVMGRNIAHPEKRQDRFLKFAEATGVKLKWVSTGEILTMNGYNAAAANSKRSNAIKKDVFDTLEYSGRLDDRAINVLVTRLKGAGDESYAQLAPAIRAARDLGHTDEEIVHYLTVDELKGPTGLSKTAAEAFVKGQNYFTESVVDSLKAKLNNLKNIVPNDKVTAEDKRDKIDNVSRALNAALNLTNK